MTLDDALTHLNAGSCIRRAGWVDIPYGDGSKKTSMHVELDDGKPRLVVGEFGPHDRPHQWTATDKAATDWEVVP